MLCGTNNAPKWTTMDKLSVMGASLAESSAPNGCGYFLNGNTLPPIAAAACSTAFLKPRSVACA
jgi:hypothetical protein